MKSSSKRTQIISLVICFLLITTVFSYSEAQGRYESSGNAKVTIEGTSNIHDWQMNSDKGNFNIAFDENLTGISGLSFTVLCESLKSESKAMDKNSYKALNTAKYKTISFTATDATLKKLSDNSFLIKSNGKLTISGVTKVVLLTAKAIINPDNSITYTGSYTFKMTDFNVEPPSIMFGAIKTGNSITVKYNIQLTGKNYLSQLTKN